MMAGSLGRSFIQRFQIQKYLVILSKWFPPRETKELLDNIFSAAWKFGIIEIDALVYTTNASWTLVTYLPYDTEDCMTLTYKNLTTLTAANYTRFADIPSAELSIKKMRNMRRCPITVVVYPCEPYVFVAENGTKFDGIEIQIVEAVAALLNFTPIYMLPQDNDGNRWPNVTKPYCLQMVTSFLAIFLLTVE